MNEAAALGRTLDRSVTYRPSAGPTPKPVKVRIGLEADEPEIWKLLMLDAEENALAPVSEKRVREVMRAGTRRQGGVVGFIDAPGGKGLAATVGIHMVQPWYTEAWVCEEMWSFVHPDHRTAKDNYVNMLIDFSKWWAEQLGMPLFMGVVSTHRTIGKVRLYSRRIPFVGAMFLHRPSVV